jgi:hypothetical protein
MGELYCNGPKKDRMREHILNLSSSRQRQVVDSCKHGNETLGFIERVKFLTRLGSVRFSIRSLLLNFVT